MKKEMFLIKILVIISILVLTSCQKKTNKDIEVLASVGDRNITLEEFRLYYELDPNFGIDSTGFPALFDELNKYIDQILAYEKAKTEKLTEDEVFNIAVNWEKRQAMLRQLYRDVVSNQISITDQELHEAFINYHSEVNVRHLFSQDKEQINAWYESLKNGADFNLLAKEAFSDKLLANNAGNLGWIKLGDLDEDFASAVENLVQNDISSPVRTRWGFHIIQLIDRKENLLATESEYLSQKKMLEKKIRNKKSQELSKKYVETYIGKVNPQPVPNTFMRLWSMAIPASEREHRQLSRKITLTNALIFSIETALSTELDKPLIQSNNESITLGYFLESLKKMPIGYRPSFKTARELSDQIGVWIRDEYLIKEAEKRELQRHDNVKSEVRRFAEEQSYYYYMNKFVDPIEMPSEIKQFFENKQPELIQKFPELRHFHTIQEWKWWKAERDLHKLLRESSLEISIDLQKIYEENKRINWDRRIRMFMIRKPS